MLQRSHELLNKRRGLRGGQTFVGVVADGCGSGLRDFGLRLLKGEKIVKRNG